MMKNKLFLGTIVLFLILMAASALFTGKVVELAGSAHVLFSWLLSLVPAWLWLRLFYLHDMRETCVFISSTFRDIHEERELLVKKVFSKLCRICDERFFSFTEVDLICGITQQEECTKKKKGQTS
jgi:hypothetical protein